MVADPAQMVADPAQTIEAKVMLMTEREAGQLVRVTEAMAAKT
jgi:hypothetical protein